MENVLGIVNQLHAEMKLLLPGPLHYWIGWWLGVEVTESCLCNSAYIHDFIPSRLVPSGQGKP